MLSKQHLIDVEVPKKIFKYYTLDKILFFDIETTGFDKIKNNVILISCGHFIEKNKFMIKQYFGENLREEKKILYYFGKELADYKIWCSYNGIAFDEPFIKRRMEINNIHFALPSKHIDLYRIIRPYYKQLGMERCNLKGVEKFLGIGRADTIDGGISVELYNEFLQSEDYNLTETIMLHNYEDVLNLPKIFKVVYNIDHNEELKREDCITDKQLKYLKNLLRKNKINMEGDLDRISKKAASRIIYSILKGEINESKFQHIIKNSY
ncbi:ribonuclease H-like domain-containing protein [Clostridium sp. MB40-C1]|uniref:ribonuclease H-like domain-containing protein n=1 Tax=Clostridium sp. MB40-C1 TaxID=3070996 RepID=UPI0027DF9C93|nr:ribonuclease H-like domain-containing protein [Clostridium sp. MB40-C1]WMJ80832.1 ribonuclease H-like domain-containing protein [Clostridium sp. MB40-C1]